MICHGCKMRKSSFHHVVGDHWRYSAKKKNIRLFYFVNTVYHWYTAFIFTYTSSLAARSVPQPYVSTSLQSDGTEFEPMNPRDRSSLPCTPYSISLRSAVASRCTGRKSSSKQTYLVPCLLSRFVSVSLILPPCSNAVHYLRSLSHSRWPHTRRFAKLACVLRLTVLCRPLLDICQQSWHVHMRQVLEGRSPQGVHGRGHPLLHGNLPRLVLALCG